MQKSEPKEKVGQTSKHSVFIVNFSKKDAADLIKILPSDCSTIEILTLKEIQPQLKKFNPYSSFIILDINDKTDKCQKFITELKQNPETANIAVIISIDRSNEKLEDKFIDLGITDYIFKPHNPKRVKTRVKNIIRMLEASHFLNELEHDELTGVYTRQAFVRKATEYLSANPDKVFGILGFDFENFKLTNTQYGEDKCNEFLAYVGHSLLQNIESNVTGRFGGDQFVIMFEKTKKNDVLYIRRLARKILESAPIEHQNVKIGICAPISSDMPIERYCDQAFLAIKTIKGVYGQDIVEYKDEFQNQLLEEQRISDSMEEALVKQQFQVYYQPKHETISGKVAGAEALVRWIHPECGFMSPGQFIPLFERNGFITKLDSYIIKKVCADIKSWQKKGLPVVPISVNISRRDYLESGWLDKQLEYIDKMEIDHSLIHVEVTESLYSEYMDLIIDQVKKTQNLGFLIEMDDFGSGYSSLGMIATFPLNVIKLDISFVRNIDVNEIIIENIIRMAHSMGLTTIAEGAETERHFKVLKSLGCDLIQGYCFSKPLPVTDFENYLISNDTSAVRGKKTASTNVKDKISPGGRENIIKAVNEIAEGLPGGFFSYHADERREIISINQELLRIYECESTEEFRSFVKNSFNNMIHPDDREKAFSIITKNTQSDNQIGTCEYRIQCKNGDVKYLKVYGRSVRTDIYGQVVYAFANDITQEKIRRKEEMQRNEVISGLSRSYNSIFLVDFETDQIIPYALNSDFGGVIRNSLEKGTSYNQIRIEYADRYVAAEDREQMKKISSKEYITQEFKNTDFFSFTFHKINNDNTFTLMELSVRRLADEKSDVRAVFAYRPVSENMILKEQERNKELVEIIDMQKENEKVYKASLKAANDAKDTFIYNLSHHIRNPMNSVMGFIGEALRSDNDPSVMTDILHKIQEEGIFLLRLINNVIKLSQIGNDELRIIEIPTDISGAVEKTAVFAAPLAKEKNIKIETWSEISNPYIFQDINNTAEAVFNIITNAINFTPNGGTVSFGLRQYPGKTLDTCIIEFKCIDTGIGMSKESLSKVFESFKWQNKYFDNYGHTIGLGLVITKQIIDLMHGTIDIKSEPGKGTEVTFIIPHRYATKAEVLKNESLIKNTFDKIRGSKILVVDDNYISLEVALPILEEAGFTVDIAHNGKNALELLKNSSSDNYDVILIEWDMGQNDSVQTAYDIRSLDDPKKASIPIIAMTNRSSDILDRQQLNDLTCGCIEKPLNIYNLVEILASVWK
ncbi:EAL domain-containing protein [Treponema sp.]|uniref:EAL domain-containing protein n=1 Tax=Treponema sp. TaxID=166 RepID=UPI00298D88E3|nr:EAL domain-containing protein [Treponema sp.]MCR5612335.1 EAL domain-containing protein [Treponema sp.]